MPLKLVGIEPSSRKGKKYVAIFMHGGEKPRMEKIHFGAEGMEDYTIHKDKKRRESYRKRAYKGKDAKPNSAAALSYWLLWGNSTSMRKNIRDFIKKYNL